MGKMTAADLEYADYVDQLRGSDPALADALVGFHGIEQVLAWMQQQGLSRAAVDIIGQDEFEYDFLIEVEPGGSWLAFGVT
jgi:hypothetical protein